ncbi:hydratase [Bradyrhizobium sp. 83002]|uniref:2-keto-4-pentenoate hydratase n=1 Tax=Bradyrhizobium aeschynomenes TaxID=2734909 RepID=UPI0015567E08|nr:hydratase [Bradyrhizobium aeschynomenes]NPU11739.1 hydratase [Bradyrhizobium aeschynomenes]
MCATDQPAGASAILRSHWQQGSKLAELPPELRPHDRAAGYAIQAALENHSDKPLFGWKIAATSEAGQRHINVAGPMAGRILAETVLPVGGAASMAGNAMRVAEPEFAFRLGVDLPPRPTPYDVAEVLAAVATLHPAIEIPDSRFADFVSAGEAQLIADNACAHLFVLGEPTTADWRSRDLIEERPRISLRGETFIGHGRNVLGDPRVALAWLVNELRQLGIPARAGQVVTTGTCHPPLPIDSGDVMEADFGDLGRVSVQFE